MSQDARAQQDHAPERVRELERELWNALNALALARAELAQAREHAAALAASLDEAQAREMELVEVVQTETARREQLSRQLSG